MVGGGWVVLQVTLLFCFRPNPKFCSFDLDLDQAEQIKVSMKITGKPMSKKTFKILI